MNISIIIPVYNTEKYLDRCIKSLLQQTFEDIEFIFINDGFSDGSLAILEYYKSIDNRIIVLNQENKGVSVARNIALSHCTGEYIGFVDSDDFVEKDMYEIMYKKAMENNSDLVICDFFKQLDCSDEFEINTFVPSNNIQDITTFTKEHFLREKTNGFMWNKLYKRSIIMKNKIEFNPQVSLCEDILFNLYFLDGASNVSYVNMPLYHYIDREGSAVNKIHPKEFYGTVCIYYKQMDSAKKWNMDRTDILKYIDEKNAMYPYGYVKKQFLYNGISSQVQKKLISECINHEYTLNIKKKVNNNEIAVPMKLKIFYRVCSYNFILFVYIKLLNTISNLKNTIKQVLEKREIKE